ncbi:MAG: UDP-glucose 6-dehydrogenase [Chlamydiae bacterium RIFCSPLOWO2_01_FULL_28_7]|nr:MAG: UDP-glucose 6-dehydrogenase [Chlamydiae bacterium RIFCSPLOWO2_01_FULL_28_7]
MDILIIGAGYVGLVTGSCLAEMGHKVICLDIDAKKIEDLNNNIIPIYEQGLEEIVKRNKKAKRLFFTTDYKEGVENSTACFICVPTPSNNDGSCNTKFVEEASKNIAGYMNEYKVIITKSTVTIGTAYKVKEIIKNELKDKNIEFDVVSNPEFLKEGSAVNDFLKPDRIVFGTESKRAEDLMKEIYLPFTVKNNRIISMSILSSEMTKYSANAMLATRISFMNEIAKICKSVGADVNDVRKGIGSDSRIGYSFLYPGIGYGGSCFPKDIRALCHVARENNIEPKLLETVDSINNDQKKILSENIISYFAAKGGVEGKTIAIWGLSFKPDTDDMREAPSLTFIETLLNKGAILKVYDPIAIDNAKKIFQENKNLIYCNSETDAAENSDAIALLTEWKQFRLINFNPIIKKLKNAVFFDGRNQYNSIEMKKKGFDYIGIGVPDQIGK